MRRPRRMLTTESVIGAALLCMVAALPGCSAASPAAGSPPAAVPSAGAAFAFTIAGARHVPPSGSQDTHAQTPKAACDGARFAADEVVGARVADGFAAAGFPVSAAAASGAGWGGRPDPERKAILRGSKPGAFMRSMASASAGAFPIPAQGEAS